MVQEIVRFLKADTAFMNIRPLRYSLILDPHPDALLGVVTSAAKRSLKLREAILSSYHYNEVRYHKRYSFFLFLLSIYGNGDAFFIIIEIFL